MYGISGIDNPGRLFLSHEWPVYNQKGSTDFTNSIQPTCIQQLLCVKDHVNWAIFCERDKLGFFFQETYNLQNEMSTYR